MPEESDGNPPEKIELRFFRTASGNEPVLEWLRDLEPRERRAVGQDLQRLQYRWPVGMPLCRSLGKGLWEVRSNLPTNKIARVIFFAGDDFLAAVHGFVKKTQRTPKSDLDLALERKSEWIDDQSE